MTSHPSSWKNARWVSTGTNRSTFSMNAFSTVAGGLTVEIVTPHATREPATTGNPDHINELFRLQQGRLERLADGEPVGIIRGAKLTKPARWLAPGFWNSSFGRATSLTTASNLGDMPATGTTGFAARQLAKTKLHRAVAITSQRANLGHHAGTSFNHRDRHNDTVGVIDLSHPDFFTNKSNRHNKHPHEKRKREQYRPGLSGLPTCLPGTIHPAARSIQDELNPKIPPKHTDLQEVAVALILMSTPAGNESLLRASTVLPVG
jgi:hypothetical protein